MRFDIKGSAATICEFSRLSSSLNSRQFVSLNADFKSRIFDVKLSLFAEVKFRLFFFHFIAIRKKGIQINIIIYTYIK